MSSYNDFDDWGISDQWDNEKTYSGNDDWLSPDDTDDTDGGFGFNFSGLFDSALTVTGDYYQAKNKLELQRLGKERESVGHTQQVPTYNADSVKTNTFFDTLLNAGGFAIVVVAAAVFIMRR